MQADGRERSDFEQRRTGTEKSTLELCFISFLAVVVLSALVTALSYDLVSARAPLVIILPLVMLIGLQFRRTLASSRAQSVVLELARTARGRNSTFNVVGGLIGWMLMLTALIAVAGHYAAIAVFMFMLLRLSSKERWRLSISIPIIVTVIMYGLFEHVFNIELYRGMLGRLL